MTPYTPGVSKRVGLPAWVVFAGFSAFFLLTVWMAAPYAVERPNDLRETVWPIILHWKQAFFVDHTWPLWRPTLMGGMPFVADPQPLIPYPPNFLLLVLPLSKASWFLYGLHMSLMGYGVYLLARVLKAARLQALLAGSIAMFAPTFIARMGSGHLNMMEAMSLAPWIFLGALQLRHKSWYFITIVLLAFQIMLYANIWYHTTQVLLAIFLIVWWRSSTKLLDGLRIASVFLFPLALTAYLLIPIFSYASESTRSIMTISELSVPTWSLSRFAAHLMYPVKDELLATGAEAMIFPGISVAVLAFIGLRSLSGRARLVVGITGLFACILALGQRTPVMGFLLATVPGYSLMRGTTRFWFLVMIGLGLLASRVSKRAALIGLIATLAELLVVGAWWLSSEPPNETRMPAVKEYLASQPKPWRVYCTTLCWSQYEVASIGGELLGGNYPLQLKDSVSYMARAGGYTYATFSVIHPPYQVYPGKPQPDSKILGAFAVEWVLSEYLLVDPAFVSVVAEGKYTLYRNQTVQGRVTQLGRQLMLTTYTANTREATGIGTGPVQLAEWYTPGWQALGNGMELSTYRLDNGTVGVNVPNGITSLEFRFRPYSVIMGAGVSLASVLLMLTLYRFMR